MIKGSHEDGKLIILVVVLDDICVSLLTRRIQLPIGTNLGGKVAVFGMMALPCHVKITCMGFLEDPVCIVVFLRIYYNFLEMDRGSIS